MINNTTKIQRLWIYTIFLTSPFYLRTGSEGLNVLDIIFAVYYFGTLYFWLFWNFFIRKINIFRNVADFFLVLFFFIGLFLVFLSVLNGVQLVDSLREYVLISFVLFYFPIRENFENKKHLISLGFVFSLAILANDVGQFYDYYRNLSSGLQYAYQLLSSTKIRINQTLFSFTILVGSLFILYPQKLVSRLWLIIVVIATTLALITTFSRTFWAITLVVFGLYLFLLPFKHKIEMLVSALVVVSSFYLVTQIFFKERADIAIEVIEKRFLSTSKGTRDLSLQARLVEYDALWSKIQEYPLQGNGFFKSFRFYNVLEMETATTTTIHNGYLFLFYRVGIPMALLFIFSVFYFAIKSLKLIFLTKDLFWKFVSISAFTGLIVMIISGFTSSQFLYRDGTFMFAISFALTEIAHLNFQNKTILIKDNDNYE